MAEERRVLYRTVLETTMNEVDDERISKVWHMVEQMSANPEVQNLFNKMTDNDNKQDFMKMLSEVENHQETMQQLTLCYQQGDWARL